MHRPFGGARPCAALLAAAAAASCSSSSAGPAGEFENTQTLVALAQQGDARGTTAITPRGASLPFLSDPYQAGAAKQAADRDGLVVQPAFSDGRPAAFATSERFHEFPKVWAQPLYLPVTGFDPLTGPQLVAGAAPVFGVGAQSRFYSPFWQTFYVTVPAGTAADALRSSETILANGYPLTPGPLRLCSIVPHDIGVAAPSGGAPSQPFTADPVRQTLPDDAWVDGEHVFYVDWGRNRFRMDDKNVVQEVALFHLALRAADGTLAALPVPPVLGTGPLRGARPVDAPGGAAQFGALRHSYLAAIAPRGGGKTPGIFVSKARAALRSALIAKVGAALVPAPGDTAEALVERDQYTLRVALDGACFAGTDFPDGCSWLDSQQAVEAAVPPSLIVDEKELTAGPVLFFDGVQQ